MTDLQRAVAWVGLRQEIRIAFVCQRAVNFALQCFAVDWTTRPRTDGDWANRIVLHLAEVLNHCFGSDSSSLESHEKLVARGQTWERMLPPSFTPLYTINDHASFPGRFPGNVYLNDAVSKSPIPTVKPDAA